VAMTSTIGLWFCAMDFAFKATIRLLFIVPLLASTGAYAGEIEGEASAIDGDSLNMQIRLFAIDTPEADQTCKDHEGRGYPCGRIASDALARLLRDKIITCEIKTRVLSENSIRWRFSQRFSLLCGKQFPVSSRKIPG
jgi:endonuclease YncB( thermonuclease family)